MRTKIKVLREMPFAKAQDEFDTTGTDGHGIWFPRLGVSICFETIYIWIRDGWVEWVEEEKPLEEKIQELEEKIEGIQKRLGSIYFIAREF